MKYTIVTILFILLQPTIYAQKSFEETDIIYAYLVENDVTELVKGTYWTPSNTTILQQEEFKAFSKVKTNFDHKIVALYEHKVNGEIKTPSGRILIMPSDTPIPTNITY